MFEKRLLIVLISGTTKARESRLAGLMPTIAVRCRTSPRFTRAGLRISMSASFATRPPTGSSLSPRTSLEDPEHLRRCHSPPRYGSSMDLTLMAVIACYLPCFSGQSAAPAPTPGTKGGHQVHPAFSLVEAFDRPEFHPSNQ